MLWEHELTGSTDLPPIIPPADDDPGDRGRWHHHGWRLTATTVVLTAAAGPVGFLIGWYLL